MKTDTDDTSESSNFIENMIAVDVANGKHQGLVATRFPPEPNGYLHIGHAKSICLNFGVASDFGGWTNLRFDDTNPDKESEEYMTAIKRDVEWLGFNWKSLCYASDYFDQLYDFATALVKNGAAWQEQPLSRAHSRGKPESARRHEKRRLRRG